jgi:hypothetical protein
LPNGSRWKLPVAVCVPLTTADGPRELTPAADGLATSTQVSSAPISVSPLELATILLWLAPEFWPAVPPNATSTVIVRCDVLANVSSQRV